MWEAAIPYEFRVKPAGLRLMIMVAGVLFNFLLALFIYSIVLCTWGDTFLPLKNVKAGMDYSETFHNVGFQDGDILLKADDTELERFGEDCFRRVLNAQTVTVLRGGVETVIPIPEDMAQRVMRDKKGFASYRFPMVVRELGKTESGESPAAVAGLQPGDSIVSINVIVTPSFYEVGEVLAQNKDKEVLVGCYRAGIPQTLTLHTDTAGKMGIYSVSPFDMYQTVTRKYGFFES